MSSGRTPARVDTTSVFLNVPFDTAYEDCFIALIAGLTGLGLTPRSVLEIAPSPDRLQRIFELLRACRYSLHDLSRVELSRGRYPRFNMPFETGLATALVLEGTGHERFLLEARSYRLQRTCSDLNGTDPKIHAGRPIGVLRALTNLFGRKGAAIDVKQLRPIFDQLGLEARLIKRRAGADGLFEAGPYRRLVVTAQALTRTLLTSRRRA